MPLNQRIVPDWWTRWGSWLEYGSSRFGTILHADISLDEILLSKDKTIAIIDGSGVLFDPAGLDRPELVRLAKTRKPVSYFGKDKLGPDGYQVLVDEQDVKLPSGFDWIHYAKIS